MRSKSPNPLQSYPTTQQKKYYTRQQVSQILRTMFENKLSHIYQQLQQKQHMIRALNEKLNNNDTNIQTSRHKTNQLTQQYSSIYQLQMEQVQDLVYRCVNDKLQQYWHVVQQQLEKIRVAWREFTGSFHAGVQGRVEGVLAEVKRMCEDGVEGFKKKNNGYWVKVKEALNKINGRTVQCEQKTSNIGLQISKYEAQRQQNSKTIKQLQNGKNTAKMLVQLKKSVNNVYKNFEEVLKLQKNVKQGYEKMGSIDKWNCDKAQPYQRNTTNAKPQWNYNANIKNQQKQDDIVILEYSVEEDTLSNHQIQSKQAQALFRPQSKSMAARNSSPANKFNKHESQGQGFPLSPITGRVIENSNYSNAQVMIGSQRFKNTHQTAVTSTSMKNETYEWGQNEQYLNQNNFLNQVNKQDRSQSFQLTTHNNSHAFAGNPSINSRVIIGNNAVSTSMLNFSLECRKQTIQSVRPRLIDLIQTKGLVKPIKVFLDQINYLKNEDGNYLFDLKGNMFKLTPNQFGELERDNIIANIKNKDQKKMKA